MHRRHIAETLEVSEAVTMLTMEPGPDIVAGARWSSRGGRLRRSRRQGRHVSGQDGLVIAGLDIDYAGRCQSRLRERWREQVWPRDAPQHVALDACCHPGRRRPRHCHQPRPHGERRVPVRHREVASRVRESGTEHRFGAPASAFELLDLRAQGLSMAGFGRNVVADPWDRPIMFPICSG